MKIRIKFSKSGLMRYIGHLDLMRCFQKVFMRSGIDICFSEGMSPHMIMSFASPLGVGLPSEGEYVDIEIGQRISSEEAIKALNAQMPEGITVISFVEVEPGKASKAMSIVAVADYEVRLENTEHFPAEWEEKAVSFASTGPVMIEKETKSGSKLTDIAPMIYEMRIVKEPTDHFFLRLASGSSANLKPELVIKAFFEKTGTQFDEKELLIHRKELYARDPEGKLVSLESLGRPVGPESVALS